MISGIACEAQWDEKLRYYDVEKITLQKDLIYSGSKDGIQLRELWQLGQIQQLFMVIQWL